MRIAAIVFGMVAAVVLGTGAAFADATVYPSPYSPRIVRFQFAPDETYTLYLRPGMVTDIQLPQDESLQSLALGDTLQWVTAQSGNNVFVKPVKGGLTTSATIITDHRTYQLMLVSIGGTAKRRAWYQQVSWNSPGIVFPLESIRPAVAAAAPATQPPAASVAAAIPAAFRSSNPMNGINPTRLYFRYRIKGDAPFRPKRIFDDGHFTWIRIPHGAWVMPALFVKEDGKYALVNYTVSGDWLIVQRVFRKAVLRAGGRTVTLWRRRTG